MAVPGYTKTIDQDAGVITNTRNTVEVPVSKVWTNETDEENPESVTAQLLRNGDEYDTVVLNAANEWKHTWTNLAAEDLNGKAYVYTVGEKAVPGYKTEIDQETGKITNTYTGGDPLVIVGIKVWESVPEGAKVPTVTLQLKQNGKVIRSVELGPGKTKETWSGLPSFDPGGKAYVYTVDEAKVPDGYEKSISEYTVTNKYTGGEKTSVTATKKWVGVPASVRVPKITLELLQNGKLIKTADLPSGTKTATWSDLPTYDTEGNAYEYTVGEAPIKGYKTKIDGFTVVNTYLKPTLPITGDQSLILAYSVAIFLSAMSMGVIIKRRRNRGKKADISE